MIYVNIDIYIYIRVSNNFPSYNEDPSEFLRFANVWEYDCIFCTSTVDKHSIKM